MSEDEKRKHNILLSVYLVILIGGFFIAYLINPTP